MEISVENLYMDTGALRVNEGNSQHYLQSKNYTQANKINKKWVFLLFSVAVACKRAVEEHSRDTVASLLPFPLDYRL